MTTMQIGSTIVWRTPGLILTGVVEEVSGDYVRARLSSPWGVPCPFSEWFSIKDVSGEPVVQ